MRNVYLYTIQKPESMIIEYSCNSEYARDKSTSGYIVTCKQYKVL